VSVYWFDIALVCGLVLMNAAFAGSEMALVSLREGQLKALEREGTPGADRLVRLARDPNRFLAAIQIGITLAGFLASATAAVSIAEPLVPAFSVFGSAAEAVAITTVTLVLTFFTLVIGELAPKRLAMQRALPWARAVARPLDALATLTRPIVAVLGAATNALVRLLGGRTDAVPDDISPDELRELVRTHRVLRPEQREIIAGALELHERTLREVLVPRAGVFWLDPTMSCDEARTALAYSGNSRAPLLSRGDGEQVTGVVHWAALADGGPAPVATVATPALFFPETLRVDAALRQFKAARAQLAVVVDEHGQVDGIVTLEDVLEEIVGEIYDETDKDILSIERSPDGSILLPGAFPVHDLPDLGIHLARPASGDYTTVAGLLLAHLGHIPDAPGETVALSPAWTAAVETVSNHAITTVRISPEQPRATEPIE
jgi:putative hemolysin